MIKTRQVAKIHPYYTTWIVVEVKDIEHCTHKYKVYAERYIDGAKRREKRAEYTDFLDVMSYIDQRL